MNKDVSGQIYVLPKNLVGQCEILGGIDDRFQFQLDDYFLFVCGKRTGENLRFQLLSLSGDCGEAAVMSAGAYYRGPRDRDEGSSCRCQCRSAL